MVWVYTADNDYKYGDRWDKEDFSVLDPNQMPRSDNAYSRPHVTLLPGKPVRTHFYSDFHYFVPEKGVVSPLHEFYVEFQSKETGAPAEIFVPGGQYINGFYVKVSDGWVAAEYKTSKCGLSNNKEIDYYTLYWYPSQDLPGVNHWMKIVQPLPGTPQPDWDYYFFQNTQTSRK
jgi:hypothetical protein